MTLDFTLLTAEQVWGNGALDAIKKYGKASNPTDLSVILGGTLFPGYSGFPDDHRLRSAPASASWPWSPARRRWTPDNSAGPA